MAQAMLLRTTGSEDNAVSTHTLAKFLPLSLLVGGSALAADGPEEFTYLLRTRDDPTVAADMSVCAKAPFPTNVAIGGAVWSSRTRSSTGGVKREFVKRVGHATACMLFRDLQFAAGTRIPVVATFFIEDGAYTGIGECVVETNDVPVRGVLLTGCHGKLVETPAHVLGGVMSTVTLINAYRVPGYETGSYLTIRGYRASGATDESHRR